MTTINESANKATLKRFYDATNTHDPAALSKAVTDIFDENVVLHNPVPTQTTGSRAVEEVFTQLDQAFPDLHVEVNDLIEEGDKVVTRSTVTGTHQGPHMGAPPTGKSVVYEEIFISRFEHGRVVELWGVVDAVSVMRQLGMLAI